MPCKVCDHTIQRLSDGPHGWFWCPRCGTINNESGVPDHQAPMIVERVLKMLGRLENPLLDTSLFDDIKILLRETIGLPLRPEVADEPRPKHKISANPDGTFSAVLADGTPQGTVIHCQDKTTLESFLDELDNRVKS